MKLGEVRKMLREKELDGLVLYADDPNFRYYLQEYLMSGMLYIPAQGKPTVFIHRLEELEHDFNVVRVEKKDEVKEFFKKENPGRVGYNPSLTSARRYFKLRTLSRLKDVGSELAGIRVVKTDEEVAHIKKAARIADGIMKELADNFDFRTEGEIKRFLKMKMAAAGVEQSFEPIVASGKGAAVPHYFAEKNLSDGFMIIDMGVKVNGYCSDITRTFYIGRPSRDERKLYEKVLGVQRECIELCEGGAKCGDAYEYARGVLGEKFTHGLGHGLGLQIHELPNLKEGSDDVFKDNVVFTVEPGWYDEARGVGIRIEDDVLIRRGKPVRLTKTSREMMVFQHNV